MSDEEKDLALLTITTIIFLIVAIVILMFMGCSTRDMSRDFHIKCKQADVNITYKIKDNSFELEGVR